MDRIIFPNGTQTIIKIDFPNHETLHDTDEVVCSLCNKVFIAGKLFDLHLEWEKKYPNFVCDPQSVADFLYRECPFCGKVSRIVKAEGVTGGGCMPNAGEVMKLYLKGEEVAELQKAGEVIGVFVGPGEIVTFDSRKEKNPDGTPKKEKKIQVCVQIGDEERFWTPNQVSMRKMIAKLGQNTEDWTGHKVKLEALKQNIAGEMKLVVYGEIKE